MLCGQSFGIGRLGHVLLFALPLLTPGRVHAHASEGALSLLLPTGVWAVAGTASVAATVIVIAALPAQVAARLFSPLGRNRRARPRVTITRALAFLTLLASIWHGFTGPGDPVRNAMPLLVWPVFWMSLVTVQALVFDLWHWLNPFALLVPDRGFFRWRFGRWPAVALLLVFAAFLLADPAPADPTRLAGVTLSYLAASAVLGLLFGPRWLVSGEVFTVLMRSYARISPLSGGRVGLWGWRAARGAIPGMASAVFMAGLLAGGSFDGLNETFFWLAAIGVNPLEFPGRSAIVAPTLAGLLGLTAILLIVYAGALRAGLALASNPEPLGSAFRRFAPSLLPIAAAYHVAHYLVSMLIDGQWVAAFLAARLGGHLHVTTGFLTTLASVRAIWLTQAGVVVGGHVIAILLAHALAVRAYGSGRTATRVTAPLSALMILYTLFGLWLLAAPRGA